MRKLKSEYHALGFSSWDQFVAMLFCQLAQARSLREISDGLKSCEGKLKHLGLEQETKGAVKLHLLPDHEGYLPVFGHVTDGKPAMSPWAKGLIFQGGASGRWIGPIPITSSSPVGRVEACSL